MRPERFPLALMGFFAFVAVVPVWGYFVYTYMNFNSLPVEFTFLATLSLPAALLLYLAGWINPGGA